MSSHAQTIEASRASRFLAELAVHAKSGEVEDWQAGGALPDILTELRREGHICDRLYVAGSRLVLDMTRCHGSSAGIIARYGDQVDSGGGSYLPSQPVDIDAFNRMDRVMHGLRQHERETLRRCVLSRELRRGSVTDMGRERSGYTTAKTARAFAVGQVQSLLESIGELYQHTVPRPG